VLGAGLGQTLSVAFTPADTTNYENATKSVTIDVLGGGGVSFTDDPLAAATTPVKAVHITELRQAIATLRTRYGLSAFNWTDGTIAVGSTPAKAVHLTELRMALEAVYVAAVRTPPTYTGGGLVARVTVVTATHITELRAAVQAIW
jgi:Tfp pilus assembly protein PilW